MYVLHRNDRYVYRGRWRSGDETSRCFAPHKESGAPHVNSGERVVRCQGDGGGGGRGPRKKFEYEIKTATDQERMNILCVCSEDCKTLIAVLSMPGGNLVGLCASINASFCLRSFLRFIFLCKLSFMHIFCWFLCMIHLSRSIGRYVVLYAFEPLEKKKSKTKSRS